MKRIVAVLAIVLVAAVSCVVPAALTHAQAPTKPDLIEVLDISGEINEGLANSIAAQVEKINETPKVKGVLLVVNSPGGGASASAVIYQEISKIKVPVVGFCEYYCASGGAYVLMAPSVKYIAVRDDSIGGSIGVIMTNTRFHRLLDWAKIDNDTFKSGALKDAGNPTREMSQADRVYLQSIIDGLASKFYRIVVKARPKVNLAEIKTAKIFLGEDIVKVGLADAVMEREGALKKLKELAGSKNAFTRDELRKITKDAHEASQQSIGGGSSNKPQMGPLDRGMQHIDTIMELLAEIRAGQSTKVEYRMPILF